STRDRETARASKAHCLPESAFEALSLYQLTDSRYTGPFMSRIGNPVRIAMLGSVVAAALILAMSLAFSGNSLVYDISRYRGDGEIRDNGFWSYPGLVAQPD